MNKTFLALGIVLLAAGVAVYFVFSSSITGRVHNYIPLGGIGLAVLGALIAAGGVMMGKAGGATAGQFKCSKCGAVFVSQVALDQHSKDKHGVQAKP